MSGRSTGSSATAAVLCCCGAEIDQVSVNSTLSNDANSFTASLSASLRDGSNGCSTNPCGDFSTSLCSGAKEPAQELSNCFTDAFSQHSQKQRANTSKHRYYQLFHLVSP